MKKYSRGKEEPLLGLRLEDSGAKVRILSSSSKRRLSIEALRIHDKDEKSEHYR